MHYFNDFHYPEIVEKKRFDLLMPKGDRHHAMLEFLSNSTIGKNDYSECFAKESVSNPLEFTRYFAQDIYAFSSSLGGAYLALPKP